MDDIEITSDTNDFGNSSFHSQLSMVSPLEEPWVKQPAKKQVASRSRIQLTMYDLFWFTVDMES